MIYEELIKRDARWLFDDLFDKARLFNTLIAPQNSGIPEERAKPLLDIDRIGGTPAYVLLLFLLAERPQADLTAISALLVRYFVRRNLTDVPPTRDLPRMFIEIIEKIRANTAGDPYQIVREELLRKDRNAPDALFKDKLRGNIYSDNVDVTRFILCHIEEQKQTRETQTDLWKRDEKRDFIWTVEHIFPQGTNVPACWVSMIADGDAEKAKDYREKYVHKLGNLTVTGYNSKLGNKSFEEKRDRKDSRGMYVGYRNGLFLNQELANVNKWQVSDIEKRTDQLADMATGLFSLK